MNLDTAYLKHRETYKKIKNFLCAFFLLEESHREPNENGKNMH